MPGTYHILPANARYRKVRVPCYQTGRFHRHKFCEVERAVTLCGAIVEGGREDGCNVSIATPSWDKDWCHKCVGMVPWTEPTREIWRKQHGIETLNMEEWKKMVQSEA